MSIFVTILAGVSVYVIGQLVLKLLIEPVQDLRRTIGAISHALIERGNVTMNPGVPSIEVMQETSREFRKLSAQLEAHLYLIPAYRQIGWLFRLPTFEKIRLASKQLLGLSNSVFRATDSIYEANARRAEILCDALRIYLAPEDRWPKDDKAQ